MLDNCDNVAVLILSQPEDKSEICINEGVRLYEKMTTVGSYGPSTIFFMAPGGLKYSDCKPGVDGFIDILKSLKERGIEKMELLLFICTGFSDDHFSLGEERMTADMLLELLDPLPCRNYTIILHGKGSEGFGPKLHSPGKIVIYTAGKGDRSDPLEATALITGDTFTMESYLSERNRLKQMGVSLVLHSM